ncbi:NUDIX domain-containing protein [Bacillus sp. JCM 19041]|uniref:NUDIX domain-containing protein n=1 Tax=Bacillus sp. JCM 19041 TaxID=1460637 RepID=UPI0006D03AAD
MHIRNSAKAIIIKEDKLLLTKNQDKEGYFYLFPGGGQEHGETLHYALQRECLEEAGYEVEVNNLLHIREYIGKNHEHAAFDFDVHQIEYYFVCALTGNKQQQVPKNPDAHQVGIEWVSINDLLSYRIYPKQLRKYVIKYLTGESSSVYLGDIN